MKQQVTMMEQLFLLSTYLVGVSLAVERLIALIKSFVPSLSQEIVDDNGLTDQKKERVRMLVLQLISLMASWITVSLINNSPDPRESICISDNVGLCWPAGVIALLSTGGSAFWNNVLGYATAARDVKRRQQSEKRMEVIQKAKTANISAKQIFRS